MNSPEPQLIGTVGVHGRHLQVHRHAQGVLLSEATSLGAWSIGDDEARQLADLLLKAIDRPQEASHA